MELKFLTSVSGPLFSFARGDVGMVEDKEEAARLIKAGYAVVAREKAVKAAKSKSPEKAAK